MLQLRQRAENPCHIRARAVTGVPFYPVTTLLKPVILASSVIVL